MRRTERNLSPSAERQPETNPILYVQGAARSSQKGQKLRFQGLPAFRDEYLVKRNKFRQYWRDGTSIIDGYRQHPETGDLEIFSAAGEAIGPVYELRSELLWKW